MWRSMLACSSAVRAAVRLFRRFYPDARVAVFELIQSKSCEHRHEIEEHKMNTIYSTHFASHAHSRSLNALSA